MLKLKFV